MTEKNQSVLRSQIVNILVANSIDSTKQEIPDLALEWWTDVSHSLKTRGDYRNLSLILNSLEAIPLEVKNSTVEIDAITLAFTFQWAAPELQDNKYLAYRLKKVLKWPQPEANLVDTLADERFKLQTLKVNKFAPLSVVHDLNLIRLGFSKEEFSKNMLAASIARPKSLSLLDFLAKQREFFKILIKRTSIFSHPLIREIYEKQALDNISGYLFKITNDKHPERQLVKID